MHEYPPPSPQKKNDMQQQNLLPPKIFDFMDIWLTYILLLNDVSLIFIIELHSINIVRLKCSMLGNANKSM